MPCCGILYLGCCLIFITEMMTFIVPSIVLPLDREDEYAVSSAKKKLSRLGITGIKEGHIYKRSVDARRKNDIHFVCSVALSGDFSEKDARALSGEGIMRLADDEPHPVFGVTPMTGRPIIVGAGPAGLFCALILAENGYRPMVIERGGNVDERVVAIERLKKERILDTDTNIQFGEGGAGTFSDGKLVTRIHDGLSSYVLRTFVSFGADESIMYNAKPHIGTDKLRRIISNMSKRITELGGEILYHTKMTDIKINGSSAYSIMTDRGDIQTGAVVLALGHSARDTYERLLGLDFAIEPKPFSVGVRIEHLREDIDRAMYGRYSSHPALKSAEYNLSCDTKSRGVYTFCMCPGGEVVAAASETGGVVVNGMSYSRRDMKNSNSAVAVSVFCDDYGNTPLGAIEFQRKIERAAFAAGGSDYSAPLCTVGDFLGDDYDRAVSEPSKVKPSYMDGEGVKLASPSKYLPDFAVKSLRKAISCFDMKIHGFADSCALLTGAETRTSAPVRILRGEDRLAVGYDNIYPVGEGAGYAGGITSASIDGIRSALALMAKFSMKD